MDSLEARQLVSRSRFYRFAVARGQSAHCDEAGRPIILKLSAGQVSDHIGAAVVLGDPIIAPYNKRCAY